MKAFIVDRFGPENGLRRGDMAVPEVGEDDVLIEVHAASVNPLDNRIRDGSFRLILPFRPPFVLGNDLAGVVVGVGARVRRFKPGDEVFARPGQSRMGTFAEVIAVSEADVAMKPRSLTMEEAASIPLVGLTAWQALVERAGLRPRQSVLIHAGSGGVGTIAIQLAKHLGATVATTTSTQNVALVESLGADMVIDYTTVDFETVVQDVDLVLDTLGGRTLDKSMRVLKPGGKVIGITGPPDPQFAKEAGLPWVMRRAVDVLSCRVRSKAQRLGVDYSFLVMQPSGAQLAEIATLVDAGVIRPVVDRVFPFESTEEALAYVAGGRARGKVVIKVA